MSVEKVLGLGACEKQNSLTLLPHGSCGALPLRGSCNRPPRFDIWPVLLELPVKSVFLLILWCDIFLTSACQQIGQRRDMSAVFHHIPSSYYMSKKQFSTDSLTLRVNCEAYQIIYTSANNVCKKYYLNLKQCVDICSTLCVFEFSLGTPISFHIFKNIHVKTLFV